MNSQVASMKPYISEKSKISQLKFTTEHVIWTEEQWDCVHFSNESMLNLFGCNRRGFVWCSLKEWCSPLCTIGSIKFRVWSVIVFGMISVAGIGPLVRLHGKINTTVYKEILKIRLYLIWKLQLINQPYLC